MNVSPASSNASTSQIKYSSTSAKEPEGTRITPNSTMFADLDRVELSKKGIALAEQRQKVVVRQKPVIGDNIVDNTDDFNKFMKAYGEKNGITYDSDDLTNGYIAKSKNKKVQNYYEMNSVWKAQRNSHDFFDSSTDFLMDAAKEYSKIDASQDFLYRPTQDSDFIKNTLNWLYGDKATQQDRDDMHNQVDSIVRELAEQIKSGSNMDLSKLQSKFSFRGDEISVTSLMDAQKLTRDFVDVLNPGATGGNEATAYGNWARRGMVESISNYYYGSLGDIGKQFKTAMGRTIDSDIEKSKESDFNCSYKISSDYAKDVSSRHKEVYERFAGLDQTSINSLNQSFSDQLDWFGKSVKGLFQHKNYGEDMQRLQNLYNSVMQHMPGYL